jgi:hypothetical protein
LHKLIYGQILARPPYMQNGGFSPLRHSLRGIHIIIASGALWLIRDILINACRKKKPQ